MERVTNVKRHVTEMDNQSQHSGTEVRAMDLVLAVLEAGAGWSWIVDDQARVRVCNQLARNVSSSDQSLPVLTGPQVEIDLAEMVHTVNREGKALEIPGLELDAIGGGERRLIMLRVVRLDLPAGWDKLFWVNLLCYAHPAELAIQNIQTEKLQSLTGLAARIAHELNNPLDGSMRYINLALRRLQHGGEVLETPGKVTEYLSSAREALGKINDILSDLVRFARSGQSTIERISLSDMIDQAIRTLTVRANTAGVSIVAMHTQDLPPAGGTRMYQVFCNLLKNAIDAVEERRRREPNASAIVKVSTRIDDGKIRVTFEDTGVGLPEDRNYLFDPFFTTKPAGEGTGLGLAISREIVHSYGGRIWAEDNPKGGARFLVELPPLDVPAQGCKST